MVAGYFRVLTTFRGDEYLLYEKIINSVRVSIANATPLLLAKCSSGYPDPVREFQGALGAASVVKNSAFCINATERGL